MNLFSDTLSKVALAAAAFLIFSLPSNAQGPATPPPPGGPAPEIHPQLPPLPREITNVQTLYFPNSPVGKSMMVQPREPRSVNGKKTTSSFPYISLPVPAGTMLPRPDRDKPDVRFDFTRPIFVGTYHNIGNDAEIFNACSDREILAIELFACGPRVPAALVEPVRAQVEAAALARGRYDVVCAQALLGEPYDGEPILYGGSGPLALNVRMQKLYEKGARYVISGAVSEYMTHWYQSNPQDPKSFRYESCILVHVTAYDMETETAMQTKVISAKGHGRTLEEADQMALSSMDDDFRSFIRANFKYVTTIEGMGPQNKKGKSNTCAINSGYYWGAMQGDTFDVFTADVTRKKLGRCRITSVDGQDISTCKMTVGAEKIQTAYESGMTLILLSDN